MRAMILAAGLGTRLHPLTNERPKALVEINGHSLLEITLARLRGAGVTDVIVNVHHFADQITDYLQSKRAWGLQIEISREEILLDTGGGLKKAADFFLRDGSDEPFLLHNVDILSSIDLRRMLQLHSDRHALATLAVQDRATSRYLLFDADGRLCGRQSQGNDTPEIVRPAARLQPLAFCGVHVLSPRIFSLLSEDGAFSIIPAYLRLASEGQSLLAFAANEYLWRDLGTVERLTRTADEWRQGTLPPELSSQLNP
jgi:NDP-sugar pyrophosphorylase family protein